MKKTLFQFFALHSILIASCHHSEMPKLASGQDSVYSKGEFGYDLQFLQKQDSQLVVLQDGDAQVVISPRYQAKVFTSTAKGVSAPGFGWINYKAFGARTDAHMNAYGGENRLWLGPEGGKYSLFFKPDSAMIFDNWKTPPPMDTESWNLESRDSHQVSLSKEMTLVNYAGTTLRLRINRKIKLFNRQEIGTITGMQGNETIHVVGYETENMLTNTGDNEWNEKSGMPCIWILDMFKPSDSTVVVVPFQYSGGDRFEKVATTNYFGDIPADRLKHNDSLLFFKADGKSRGKLGIVANRTRHMAGSYDGENKVLTIILFDVEDHSKYLNQEWNIKKPAFAGDAVNAYNDGPLANGSQMGPFYEMESVSPAAFLKPGNSIIHRHSVFHFSGAENELSDVAVKVLGVSLENIQRSFPNSITK